MSCAATMPAITIMTKKAGPKSPPSSMSYVTVAPRNLFGKNPHIKPQQHYIEFGEHKIMIDNYTFLNCYRRSETRSWWEFWRPKVCWVGTVAVDWRAEHESASYAVRFTTEAEMDQALADAKDMWMLYTDKI